MTTKTHPERDFTNRAITMLKAYEALEDFTHFSKYTHEVFVKAWNDKIAYLKDKRNPIEPIEFLQIPFRIAQFNDDDAIKKQYTAYIEKEQERLGENTNAGDHVKKYQNLSPEERPERIFDDDLFTENDPIALEFNFAYRFAQYAQICIEQNNKIFIDVFLGLPFESNNSDLPDELRNILNNITITDSPKDFWEKWKAYFSPKYMNMEDLDKFFKVFILSVDKEHPEKIALKEILLKARLFNVIYYPIDELDNPGENLFLKLRILKKFAENKNIDLESIKNKLNGITPEHNLSKKKKFLDKKWSIATLVNSFSNIIPIISQIKKFISFNNTNKDQLEINEKLLSGDPKFLILDKIELPLKKDNEPKWLFPLAQLFFQLKQNPQNSASYWVSFIQNIIKGETPIIEGEDPSEFVSEFLILLAIADFMSRDTRQLILNERTIDYPNIFDPNIAAFRTPLIMGFAFAHPKISKFLTTSDLIQFFSVDLIKSIGNTLEQLLSTLSQFSALKSQDESSFIDTTVNQLKQLTPDNVREITSNIFSQFQELPQRLASQQEKNDPEIDNNKK